MSVKVLITGGAGFIGCNLARKLLERGHRVAAVDNLFLGRFDNLPAEVETIQGDVADAELWERVPPADYVVHLAGASSAPMFPGHLSDCFHNNIVGFVRTLEYAQRCGAKRVAYASTSSVYGNVPPPLREDGDVQVPNFYATSKYCMEQIAHMFTFQYSMDVVGFRFMSVYGPREDHKHIYANLISQFIWEVEAGRAPVIYGDGNQTRDFTNVWDIVQALCRALEYDGELGSTIFNVGTGVETPLLDVVHAIGELSGKKVEPQHIVNPIQRGYVQQQVADIARARRVLGYEPTVTLRDGVREILELRAARRGA